MATLTAEQLTELRQGTCRDLHPDFNKTQINAMLQAIEDWFEAARPSLNTAINTATAPYVFSAANKKKALSYWCAQKYGREV